MFATVCRAAAHSGTPAIRSAAMRTTKMNKTILNLLPPMAAMLLTATAYAAVPGITGTSFNLTAQAAYLNMPDGEAVYTWGYGCQGGTATFAPTLGGASFAGATCPTMQIPGPTQIVRSEEHTSELQSLR